jgi:REP element-mobilizing transposase RayT
MSSKYKFLNPDGVYFIAFAIQGRVDVFTRNEYKNILIDNLAWCQKNKGLELFAWCIMTNHVYLIARAEEGLVFRAEDYVYCSAIDYAGGKGMLEIFVIE